MTKRNENQSRVKYSTAALTSDYESVTIAAFNTEKNAKGVAYAYILSTGQYDRFKEFYLNYTKGNPHRDCLDYLLSKN